MKNLLLIIVYLTITNIFAQKHILQQVSDAKSRLNATIYTPLSISTIQTLSNHFVANNSVIQFDVNQSILNQIEISKPALLNFSIPTSNKSNIIFELIPNNIFGESYKVLDATNQEIDFYKGVHYKGVIKDDDNSLVAISIVNGEITGVISNEKGNFILGKLKNSTNYIYYNDKDLINNVKFKCDVDENALKKTFESKMQQSIPSNSTATVCTSAKIYVEADKAIFTTQGSDITTTANFVNVLFGQVAVIYDNEGIFIQISQLKIWNSNDPYINTSTTASMLDAFTNQVGSTFVGDIAQLLSGRLSGGTANAYLDICNKGLAVCAGMNNIIDNVPIYSQNVLVFAHEMGHSFGSPHTHSCSWTNGAIDNCGPMAGFNEGCTGPIPTYGGGTIMSYCHLVGSVGTNFINGFGTLPGNLVRDRTSICVSGLGTAPTNLVVKEAYSTSVLLSWDVSGGRYTLQYKPTSSSVWTTIVVTTNYCRIFNLMPNTNYNWQIKASCSTYATSTFSTNNTPTPEPSYCNISYTNSCNAYGIGINDVILNGVNFNPTSGCGSNSGYSLISSTVRNLLISQTYSLTINQLWIGAGSNPVQATVWIDYNKNGEFEYSANPASNERVFTSTNSYTLTGITGTFTIPSGLVTKNNTRMRVVLNYINNPQSPCGIYQYGETEDFVVNITSNSNPCPQYIILVNNVLPTQNISSGVVNIQASSINGAINASNFITGIGTQASYKAKTITLTNGFKADKGTIFEAMVGGCN